MKIFAVYAQPILIEKPEWFDDFYRSYGGGYDLHITLKQSCSIDEQDERDIKNILADLFHSLPTHNRKIDVILDTLVIPEEGCIMVTSQKNPLLYELQKKIVEALKGYTQYTEPELEAYEKNFIPHITIAEDVSRVKENLDILKSDCFFRAAIRDITGIFVKEQTLEEALNQKNKAIYPL